MGEIGEVTELLDLNKIKVKLKRTEACAKCRACTAGFKSEDMYIIADNICNANKNDFVNIELESIYFFKAMGIMYGIPLVFLLTGFFVGYKLSSLTNIGNQDIISFITGILFMIIAYMIIRILYKKNGDEKFLPTATQVVNQSNV